MGSGAEKDRVACSPNDHGVRFENASPPWDHDVSPVRDLGFSGAQAGFIALAIYCYGNWFGDLFTGWIQTHCTSGGLTDWRSVFGIPAAVTILCALSFLIFFKKGAGPAYKAS